MATREQIIADFEGGIRRDQEMVEQIDAGIRKFNEHPKIVKLVLNKMAEQPGPRASGSVPGLAKQ